MTAEQTEIEKLIAKNAVREALQRYARGIDRGNVPLALSAFHPDAVLRHGFLSEVSPEEWVSWVVSRSPLDRIGIGVFDPADDVVVSQQHHLTNQTVDLYDDTAFSECYFLEYTMTLRRAELYLTTVGGRYVERYECRNDDWRIAERDAVRDWDSVQLIPARFPGWESSPAGRRDGQDLSYWGGRAGSTE
ncbi:MAG TPA: nuclear transport factor 2 family protein [Jatrophihabitantaceae bacterium]